MNSVRRDRGWAVVGAALVSLSAGRVHADSLPALWAGPPANGPLPDAAAPFHLVTDAQSRDRATACLAAAIYYEAGDQSREGQEAVAQVVLNRVRHPTYPKSVCGVVYQGAQRRGCQFTFACDGSLGRVPDPLGWRGAMDLAARALGGYVADSVGVSTHYHTVWVRPAWSGGLTPTRRIGAHQFYRMPGDALSLTGVYAGAEPEITPSLTAPVLRVASLRPPGASRPQMTAIRTPLAQPSQFSVWGVEVAVVTPERSGVVVSEGPGS